MLAVGFVPLVFTRIINDKSFLAEYERRMDSCVEHELKKQYKIERKLGEVDRARAIYMHGSQEVDPRTNEGFWSTWHDFEVAHGNEDTFREMLRVKRSVKAHFSQAAPAPRAGEKRPRDDEAPGERPADQMAALEEEQQPREAPQWRGGEEGGSGGTKEFTPSASFAGARPGWVFTTGTLGTGYYRDGPAPAPAADEEIDIDDDGEPQIEQLKVPSAVFGAAGIGGSAEPMGAMERLRARQG